MLLVLVPLANVIAVAITRQGSALSLGAYFFAEFYALIEFAFVYEFIKSLVIAFEYRLLVLRFALISFAELCMVVALVGGVGPGLLSLELCLIALRMRDGGLLVHMGLIIFLGCFFDVFLLI